MLALREAKDLVVTLAHGVEIIMEIMRAIQIIQASHHHI
jgi:hypothetical protein